MCNNLKIVTTYSNKLQNCKKVNITRNLNLNKKYEYKNYINIKKKI